MLVNNFISNALTLEALTLTTAEADNHFINHLANKVSMDVLGIELVSRSELNETFDYSD